VLVLRGAHKASPKKEYLQASADAVNHLFGRNYYARSYVTGLGARPPMHPHDRRSTGDTVADPWPGYLVGGPNPKATSWNDAKKDYRTNEIAINWNGALIYALAALLGAP
jgi:endoglucanase